MKTATILVAAALLALPALALVPTAAAERCGFWEPTVEAVACGAYASTWCARYAADSPKEALQRLALCDAPILP